MRSLSIVGAAIAALGLTGMPSPAMASISALSMRPAPVMASIGVLSMRPVTAVASNGVLPVALEASVAASDGCERCVMPAPLRDGEAGLVITTTLADGGYIAVWQSKTDSLVYGQSYSPNGQPRSGIFRINAEVKDGILPVILTRKDGGFVARWQRDGQRFEQYFSSRGILLEN